MTSKILSERNGTFPERKELFWNVKNVWENEHVQNGPNTTNAKVLAERNGIFQERKELCWNVKNVWENTHVCNGQKNDQFTSTGGTQWNL